MSTPHKRGNRQRKSSPKPKPPAPGLKYHPELRMWLWQKTDQANTFTIQDVDEDGDHIEGPVIATVTVDSAFDEKAVWNILQLISNAPQLWRALRLLNRWELWHCAEEDDLINFGRTTSLLAESAGRKPYDVPDLSPDESGAVAVNERFEKAKAV